jgi:hypothetical protein
MKRAQKDEAPARKPVSASYQAVEGLPLQKSPFGIGAWRPRRPPGNPRGICAVRRDREVVHATIVT